MGPPGPGLNQYVSRYSMSRTCGPRDIISLVIPRIGDNKALKPTSILLNAFNVTHLDIGKLSFKSIDLSSVHNSKENC
jgi:hypothetical protein